MATHHAGTKYKNKSKFEGDTLKDVVVDTGVMTLCTEERYFGISIMS